MKMMKMMMMMMMMMMIITIIIIIIIYCSLVTIRLSLLSFVTLNAGYNPK
jgi:hypothetical protein